MQLLSPWWLLLFLPLAGILLALYLLKLRRRDHLVSSVFLWEQALQDLQANAPLQKLRRNILLLIQLLILLCAIFALTRPVMEWSRSSGKTIVVIIDASASMESTDVFPSRFAAAKRAGNEAIESLGPHDRMMLIAVGSTTQAVTPFTNDKRALHTALDRIEVSDARADLRAALELVDGLVKGERAHEKPDILVISDGAMPAINLPAEMALPVHFHPIGQRCDNVGIVMLDIRQQIGRPGYEGLLAVKNFSDRARTVTLEISLNGKLQDARAINLPAGGQHAEVLPDLPAVGGLLRATLDVKDDLAIDNQAQIILPKTEPVPVMLVSTGNLFLQTALSLDPTLHVTESTTLPTTLPPGALLIVDNVPVRQLPAGTPALLIGNAGPAGCGTIRHLTTFPTVADWDRHHPITSQVDFTGVRISTASVVTPAPDARVLVDTNAGPIALTTEAHGRRIVYLGWDLHRSDFPLRVSFPIFLANSIDWLSGQRRRAGLVNVRTGQEMRLPLPPDVTAVDLLRPDGKHERLAVDGGQLVLNHLNHVGVYHITAPNVDLRIAVNLLDPIESNTAPQAKLVLNEPSGQVSATPKTIRTEREVWRILALVALVLLCAEWWIFHRRIG